MNDHNLKHVWFRERGGPAPHKHNQYIIYRNKIIFVSTIILCVVSQKSIFSREQSDILLCKPNGFL